MQLLLPAMAVTPKTCLQQIPAMRKTCLQATSAIPKKKNPLRRATRKDHGHHEAEMKKTDQESDYEFADVSDPEEQYDFIMDKMMNMDEDQYQAYKKKHPRPSESHTILLAHQ